MPDFIIDDSTSNDVIFDPQYMRGGEPRDFNISPIEMFDAPSTIPLIPRHEWDARIEEQERLQSSLEHIRATMANGQHMESLDQNGQGYCWAYSTTVAHMFARAVANLPYKRLSAHAVGCKVMGFRDRGGWSALSAQFIRENGVPDVEHWTEKSMSQSNDNPRTWENAKKHLTGEYYADLTRPVHGQNLTFDMVASCLLQNIPCAVDWYWWGHAVGVIRLVKVERGAYGLKAINSWTDRWGDRGMGVITGDRMIPNGAIAIRTVRAAA